MPGDWAASNRGRRLPPDWPERRITVLQRDGHVCQIRLPGCITEATEADHIQAGDDHRLTNLQAACTWCHGRKSSAEGNTARRRFTSRRPAERHPGLL